MGKSRDLLVLLGYGLAIGGCGAAVDDSGTGTASATGGEGRDELEEAIAACGPWAQHYVACYNELYGGEYEVSYLSFMGYCIGYFGYATIAGPGCAEALGDYYACLANIDCDVLTGEGDGDGESLCVEEEQAREQACDVEIDSESDSEDIPATDAGDASDSSSDDGGSDSSTG